MKQWEEDLISVQGAQTLDGLLVQRVHRSPDRVAYRRYDRNSASWIDLTWTETAAQTSRWQEALSQESLEPGDRVAVLLRNCPEWVQFDQASLGLGLVVVPLYTDDRPENVAYILEDAAVKLLLVQDVGRWKRLAPALSPVRSLRRVVILEEPRAGGDGSDEDPRVVLADNWLPPSGSLRERRGDPHSLASIVYTSGTTGRPKGVMLSHYNMLSIAYAGISIVECYVQDLFLSFLPLSHTLERTGGYYLPMMSGSTVAYSRSVAQLAEDLQTLRPTVLIAVPRIFEKFYARVVEQMDRASPLARRLFDMAVDVGWHRFEYRQGRCTWGPDLLLWPALERLVARKVTAKLGGRLRVAVSGGAALSPDVSRLFIGLGVPLLQGYGLTETSPVISVNRIQDNLPASVGKPLPAVQVHTGDQDELLVKSPGVMMGYWNNRAATDQIIDAQGWLHTGDQARVVEGRIFITGRLKDILVLSNGEKVPPADMEMAIAMDPLFEQAMVVGEGKPFLSALVVMNPEYWPSLAKEYDLDPSAPESLSDSRLNAHLLSRIKSALENFPGYAKIRRVTPLLEPWSQDNDLLTPTLKIKRAKVLERYQSQVRDMYDERRIG